jgi:hypothetical protein
VAGVALVVGFSQDAFTPLVKGLGIVSPFLTCIVYIAVALHRDLTTIEAKRDQQDSRQQNIEDDQRAWGRERERMEIELSHQERMAKIEAKTTRNNPQPGPHISEISAQNGPNFPPLRVPKPEWRIKAHEIFVQNPQISGAELGRLIGASERTGQNIINEFRGNGHEA